MTIIILIALLVLTPICHKFLLDLFKPYGDDDMLNSRTVFYLLLVPPVAIIVTFILLIIGFILNIRGK